MKSLMKFSLVLVVLLSALGCSEEPITSGVATSSDVVGYIQLMDLFTRTTDYSGITVTLIETGQKTETDSFGKWVLKNVPRGTYLMEFSKPGYVTIKVYNLLVSGNGTVYYVPDNFTSYTLYLEPDYLEIYSPVLRPFEDMKFDTTLYPNFSARFSAKLTMRKPDSGLQAGEFVYATYFFSKSPVISPTDLTSYTHTSTSYNIDLYPDTVRNADFTLYYSDFINRGYRSGDTVFCSAWALPTHFLRYYFDHELNSYSLVGYSKSHTELRSFVLP